MTTNPSWTKKSAIAVASMTYPETFGRLPEPLALPWGLKPVWTADFGIDALPTGARKYWIRHEVLEGVTPRMLAWWFSHLEGTIEIGGHEYNRYRVWHPYDHVHASYAWRAPDGSVGPGAAIRLREVPGRHLAHAVNVTSDIEKLDEEGFIHCPVIHAVPGLPGIRGIARMEYEFHPVPRGTEYRNCLILGSERWLLNKAAETFTPNELGEVWFRHNIEEVGAFEEFLPELYWRETGHRT